MKKWEINAETSSRILSTLSIYPFGPRVLLGWSSSIEAVARFAASVERELGLAIRARRSSSCASPGMDAASPTHSVDLAACPERAAHGVPVGILRDEAGEPLLVPCGPRGVERPVFGSSESITVGGVPVGEEDFEMEWMARRGATVAGYITST